MDNSSHGMPAVDHDWLAADSGLVVVLNAVQINAVQGKRTTGMQSWKSCTLTRLQKAHAVVLRWSGHTQYPNAGHGNPTRKMPTNSTILIRCLAPFWFKLAWKATIRRAFRLEFHRKTSATVPLAERVACCRHSSALSWSRILDTLCKLCDQRVQSSYFVSDPAEFWISGSWQLADFGTFKSSTILWHWSIVHWLRAAIFFCRCTCFLRLVEATAHECGFCRAQNGR